MDLTQTYNISTQQVQIFLKAVELKNFTQVANYFSYTPSMVSKTISAMEEELGLQLFIRKPHDLNPTSAAKLLAGEWRHFISSFNNSVEKALACQNQLLSRVILGFVDSSDAIDEKIGRILLDYSRQNPEANILAEKHDMHRSAELLNVGMLDLILTDSIEVPFLNEHHLPWEKVADTPVTVYVPQASPLFEKDFLAFEDLKGMPLLVLDTLMHPPYISWIHSLCGEHGFTPNIAETFRTIRSLMFALKLGKGIFIGTAITGDWQDEKLKAFTLPESTFTLLAWRNTENEELTRFKDYLKERL